MLDINKKENKEQEIPAAGKAGEFLGERQENILEKSEMSGAELEMIREELRREIELMDQDPNLKKEAEDKAKKIGSLAIDEIIGHLLEIAAERGLAFAVGIAKKTGDPFIIDSFHDFLKNGGYYKKFVK